MLLNKIGLISCYHWLERFDLNKLQSRQTHSFEANTVSKHICTDKIS